MTDDQLLTDRLRTATRAAHEEIERKIDLFGQPLTVERYRRLLLAWKSFHQYWDASGAAFFPTDFFAPRRKLEAIESDLCGLEGKSEKPSTIPFDKQSLRLENGIDALGVLYVVEGSTLGGQVIASAVGKALPAISESSLGFFRGYGAETARHWRDTKHFINQTMQTSDQQRAVDSAVTCFAALGSHLENI